MAPRVASRASLRDPTGPAMVLRSGELAASAERIHAGDIALICDAGSVIVRDAGSEN
jgi:hypothetical protein